MLKYDTVQVRSRLWKLSTFFFFPSQNGFVSVAFKIAQFCCGRRWGKVWKIVHHVLTFLALKKPEIIHVYI